MKINSHGKPNIIGQDDSHFLTPLPHPIGEMHASEDKKNRGFFEKKPPQTGNATNLQ